MGPVLTVLAWSALAVLAALLLAILTPMHVRLRVEKAGSWTVRVDIAPVFGLVPVPAFGAGCKRRPTKATDPDRRTRTRPAASGRRGFPARRIAAVPELVRGLLSPIRIARLEVDARFGLDDPAETGAVYGWLTPMLFTLGNRPPVVVALAPVFSGAHLEGRALAAVRVVPARLLPPAVRFAWRAFGPQT